MAISRNIKPDRGLTYRMLLTGFFFVVLYAVFIGVLFALLHSLVLILIIGVGLLFCQYWFSAKIAMYAMHAKEVTPEQAPQLHGVVDRLCALADMPKPKVAIATTDMPNAFATGRSPKAAVVCVTTGLLRRLDEPEVEAVLSHEISHVAHRDVAVMTIASGLGMLAGLLTRVMFYAESLRRRRPQQQQRRPVGAHRDDRLAGVGRRLLHQLPPDDGAVPLPRAGGRPLGRVADRPALAARLRAGQDHRRHGAHPDQGPARRRAVQRLLLHPGRGQRGHPGGAAVASASATCSGRTRRSSAGWPNWTRSSASSARPAERPRGPR